MFRSLGWFWSCGLLLLVLLLNGAIPGLLLPTAGQAGWVLGFADSMQQQGWFNLYAVHFGIPQPAAMAFGLPGAWLSGVLMRLGIEPMSAYALTVAAWLSLAFFSARQLAKEWGANVWLASLLATVWLIQPIIIHHQGYSMLASGMALLSCYFLSLWWWLNRGRRYWLLYALAALFSLFMDGYSFMLFAVGASAILAAHMYQQRRLNAELIVGHILAMGLAYACYTSYIGTTQYAPSGMDFFRGWGVDLTYWLQPSKGMHWLADVFNLSEPRYMSKHFGDFSVWETTFILPLLLALVVLLVLNRLNRVEMGAVPRSWLFGAVLAMLFAGYMAMGPSFKLASYKPEGIVLGGGMAAEYARFSTGSHIISENIPGFSAMRASYRWTGLLVFMLWVTLVILMVKRSRLSVAFIGSLLVISYLPNVPERIEKYREYFEDFQNFDEQFREPLADDVAPGEIVVFLPWGNDFAANYLAPAVGVRSLNIGGDKNVQQASQHWPDWMKPLGRGSIQSPYAKSVATALQQGEVDAVVIPKVDMLWAPHNWPSERIGPFDRPTIEQLRTMSDRQVLERPRYWLVR